METDGEPSSQHAVDLDLARRAANGDRAALEAAQALLAAEVAAAAASVGASSTLGDEVLQRLSEHLLVGASDRAAAIAEFSGRGPLRGFFRVCAVRECLRLMKRERREVELVDEGPEIDPELERLKARYREQFNESFAAAIMKLTPRERTLLRQQAIDRLSIDQIGAIYGVHRATAARWLERARERVAELTEQLIAEKMMLDSKEVASVIRLVSSQLDVSLERLLR
jgi:RNA polymerase sigma-70 factor, ECF subfamily